MTGPVSGGPVAAFCLGLRQLQQASGLDRTRLARRLSYSRSQLYQILDGRISRPPEWDRSDSAWMAWLWLELTSRHGHYSTPRLRKKYLFVVIEQALGPNDLRLGDSRLINLGPYGKTLSRDMK